MSGPFFLQGDKINGKISNESSFRSTVGRFAGGLADSRAFVHYSTAVSIPVEIFPRLTLTVRSPRREWNLLKLPDGRTGTIR